MNGFKGFKGSLFWPVLFCCVVAGCSDPQARKAEHVKEGWTYFNGANFAKARVEFQNALQIDPDDAAARYGLGQTFERLGDVRSAFGQYNAAADDPKHAEARVALARLLLLSGDMDGARQRVDEALALAPKDAAALAVRAGLEAAAGDREAAEATAQAALATNPGESGAVSLLASLYMRSNRYEEAHELLRSSVAANPRDVGLRAVHAQVLLEANMPDKAIEQLEAIAQSEPDNLSHMARLLAVIASTGKVDLAQERLDQFVSSRPSNDAKLLKIDFLRRFRSPAAAVAALREYAAAAPADAELGIALAGLLADTGDVTGAESEYRKIIAADKADKLVSDAQVGLASLLMRSGRVADARTTLVEILEREPANGRALGLRGQIALAQSDAGAAISDLRAALRDDPSSGVLQRLLATAYRADGQPLLAKETLMNAVQMSPADAVLRRELYALAIAAQEWDLALTQVSALETVGAPADEVLDLRYRALIGRGDFDGALPLAEQLAQSQQSAALGEYYVGAALQALQRPQEAEAHYLAALRMKPDAAEPLTALVRLYLGGKRTQDAEHLLIQTTTQTPQNAIVQNLLGQVLLATKRPKDALPVFERTVALKPHWAVGYRGLASTQSALGDGAAAEATYRRGIAATHDIQLYLDLALVLDEAGRHEQTLAVYEAGVARHVDSLVLANNLAMALVTRSSDEKSLARALAMVQKLARSDDPAYIDTVGWVHYKVGRLAEAEEQLARAVAKAPEAPLLRYHYAQVLADRGAVERARGELDEALKASDFSERAAAVALRATLEGRQSPASAAGA
jgi:predicted Zn-dependent protease